MKAAHYEVSGDGLVPPSLNSGTKLTGAGEFASHAFKTLVEWNRRATMRKHLLDLSPRMLRDMGLSLEDAMLEAEKPFWRK